MSKMHFFRKFCFPEKYRNNVSSDLVFDGDHESTIIFRKISMGRMEIVKYKLILACIPRHFNNSKSQRLPISLSIPSLNPVFHGLSFGIKFIEYPTWHHSITPLAKGYAQPGTLTSFFTVVQSKSTRINPWIKFCFEKNSFVPIKVIVGFRIKHEKQWWNQ